MEEPCGLDDMGHNKIASCARGHSARRSGSAELGWCNKSHQQSNPVHWPHPGSGPQTSPIPLVQPTGPDKLISTGFIAVNKNVWSPPANDTSSTDTCVVMEGSSILCEANSIHKWVVSIGFLVHFSVNIIVAEVPDSQPMKTSVLSYTLLWKMLCRFSCMALPLCQHHKWRGYFLEAFGSSGFSFW